VSRIAHVSAYYAPAFRYGGPPRSIHGLCRALCRHGLDVRVFTTNADGPGILPPSVTSSAEYEGVPVHYFERSWPATPIGSRGLTAGLRAALPSVDLVHLHGLWNRVVWSGAREARRAGVPYVVSPRGMLQDAARAHKGWRKRAAFAVIERGLLEGAALLHATSDAEADTLERLELRRPVILIPNGIEAADAASGVAGPGGPGDGPSVPADAQPVVLFVGRLHPIKRLDLLVDAFVLLRQRCPGARLVIAGPDEYGLRPGLEARAGSAGPAITWCGEVDGRQRDALLKSALALVLCSDSESFGMSVLEALAAGTAVVVTTTCGWGEVERHGAGLRVEQSPEAIAGALARLVADPAGARAMGARGRELAESRYTWPRVAEAFAAAYDRLLNDGPAPSPAHAAALRGP
jgi:glycosyltransferase involved in cell wall biosynthesis